MTTTMEKLSNIKATLRLIDVQIRQVTAALASEDLCPVLNEALHNPEKLPEAELAAVARNVIDSMDSLQLKLVPSVLLLADGLFGAMMTNVHVTFKMQANLLIFIGYLNSKALSAVVVEYKVPDILKEKGPLAVVDLARLAKAQPERLEQLMDTLVNNGIFQYDSVSRRFSNNRSSVLLCHDHWTQWHLWADQYPNRFFPLSNSIPAAIREGETRCAAQIEYNTDLSIFEYLSEFGGIESFHLTLGAGAKAMAGGATIDYPWGELGNMEIVDLGGASGDFLVSVLRAHPLLQGSVVDLQHAIDIATQRIRNPTGPFSDVSPRINKLYAGDFFGDILPASVYVMKWCLHNWMDQDVVRILRNAREKLIESPKSRFIIMESVKTPGRSGRLARYGDLVMMVTTNGKERSQDDWERLARSSGWHLNKVYHIRDSWVSAIELIPE